MSEKVLDWRNRRSWLRDIRSYASTVLTQELVGALERDRPECWSDVMDWLPNYDEVVPAFCEQISSFYTHFKAFHGCRPESLSTYYLYGVKGQNAESIIQKFRTIFADVSPADIENAIEDMKEREASEKGKIWLTGDDRVMLDHYGHYAINGSEYLLGLAASLSRGNYSEDYRLRLRKIGIPTILEVDIPIGLIPHAQRMAVAKMILSEWGQLRTRRPLGMSSPPSYVIRADIPPGCIKTHYHPAKIQDPHQYNCYVNHAVWCEHCSVNTIA